MEALIPVAVALVLVVIAWKVLKGLIKIGAIVLIAGVVAYVLISQGLV